MLDGLFAYCFICMLQGAKFIAALLTLLVLEGIGVYSIESKPVLCCQCLYRSSILGNIPWNVKGNCTAGLIEGMEQPNIFNLFFKVSWLTSDRKPAKPCTA